MTAMDEQTKLFIEISRNLGEINSKLGSLCETIARHELRLTEIKKKKKVRDGKSNNGVLLFWILMQCLPQSLDNQMTICTIRNHVL